MSNWIQIKDGNLTAFEIFSRHYTFRKWRKRDGKNGKRFAGPGEQIILLSACKKALFVWRKEIWRRDSQTGICCAVFRNESEILSSLLIKEAVDIAQARWPSERLFTFVDASKIKSKHPGACFHKAGWRHCGKTKAKGLYILEYGIRTARVDSQCDLFKICDRLTAIGRLNTTHAFSQPDDNQLFTSMPSGDNGNKTC